MAAGCLMVVKAVLDCVSEVYVIRTKRRMRLQEEQWTEAQQEYDEGGDVELFPVEVPSSEAFMRRHSSCVSSSASLRQGMCLPSCRSLGSPTPVSDMSQALIYSHQVTQPDSTFNTETSSVACSSRSKGVSRQGSPVGIGTRGRSRSLHGRRKSSLCSDVKGGWSDDCMVAV
eukprot:TRINITY_DN5007_c0_g1_i1.p2 TRINITY_DN5007_c0_g1~~TRINITY_DN5007_c0_g1_i1.p2  ORF type:complete len:172 (+),score=29.29 TRINITY_DN5007_c0_g1_i1:370-885(+)